MNNNILGTMVSALQENKVRLRVWLYLYSKNGDYLDLVLGNGWKSNLKFYFLGTETTKNFMVANSVDIRNFHFAIAHLPVVTAPRGYLCFLKWVVYLITFRALYSYTACAHLAVLHDQFINL